jgi:hypothetical protein
MSNRERFLVFGFEVTGGHTAAYWFTSPSMERGEFNCRI